MMIETQWPPTYTIRRSGKARSTFLQITPKQGLEIVVPNQLRRLNIEQLLQEKRVWIEKMLRRFTHAASHPQETGFLLPTSIELKALAENWQIIYEATPSKKVTVKTCLQRDKTVLIKGNVENILLCKKGLVKWIIKLSRYVLVAWLKDLSQATGFQYNGVSIRGQTTLWGSCNAKKNISLNYKLLFLPKTLVQHVLLHELCHTKYLNHSLKFWHLLKSLDENFKENKKSLKTGDIHLPHWLQTL